MIIETNHPPKMLEILEGRQLSVNGGCGSNRMFYLETSNPGFGLRALCTLVRQGKVMVIPVGSGNSMCRLTSKLG